LAARELNRRGSTPAEYASITSFFKCLAHPSAIWLRHALPVQRKSTFNFFMIEKFSMDAAGGKAGANLADFFRGAAKIFFIFRFHCG
jgi:hypothetical protein